APGGRGADCRKDGRATETRQGVRGSCRRNLSQPPVIRLRALPPLPPAAPRPPPRSKRQARRLTIGSPLSSREPPVQTARAFEPALGGAGDAGKRIPGRKPQGGRPEAVGRTEPWGVSLEHSRFRADVC